MTELDIRYLGWTLSIGGFLVLIEPRLGGLCLIVAGIILLRRSDKIRIDEIRNNARGR